MANHAQLDNVIVVSYAGPPKSGAPITGDSGIPTLDTAFFSSIQAMDEALLNDAGYAQANIDSMSVNDKVFALRQFLEGGGTLTSLNEALPSPVSTTTDPTTSDIHPWGTVWLNTSTQEVFQTSGSGDWTSLVDFA